MISLVRVDDRLIHGQITVGWVPYLNADRIAVINDRISANPVLSAIIRAGATAEVEVDVLGIAAAAAMFAAGGFESGNTIILFESLGDVIEALRQGMTFKALNLGGIRRAGEGHRLGDAVFLTGGDREIVDDLVGRGMLVEMRLMPRDRPVPVPSGGGGP